MQKVSQTTKPTGRLSLAKYISPNMEAAFEAKAHLTAAWDFCIALLNDEGDKNEERILKAFQEAACIVDECIGDAMAEAAQEAGDAMRREAGGFRSACQ